MKWLKSADDYWKVMKVLGSCETFQQLNTACNMVYNYGKMYGFNSKWRALDTKSSVMWRRHVDGVEYKERVFGSEQETSVNTEG